MGKLLRLFWQPIALSTDVKKGDAIPVKVLGDELTLFRGDSGEAHLVAGRCRHRQTLLHTGWVHGDTIRCMYHGWRFDGSGACVERPAEKEAAPPPAAKIAGYPVREYCGLVFAWLGEGEAPEFDLPRKDALEAEGVTIVATKETWKINWFQQIENSLDATHVSFVHRALRVASFGDAVTDAIPELSYAETEAGIEQTARRGAGNVRKSNWTFPNNNHVVVPGLTPADPWIDFVIWMVPADDEHSTRFTLYALKAQDEAQKQRLLQQFEKYGQYNADEHFEELFLQRKGPEEGDVIGLISAQDYIAQRGQGIIADRELEMLGKSDLGVITLRRIFWRELEAVRNGKPTKPWRKRELAQALPTQPGQKNAAAAA
ncbi:Rieske 2Fe-2S domain-containing protein [Ramlibacter sp. G-1-2-2]|uniref:Rieske 2Fe-2S domain-containing protein n=2 Tax=Ramlibacter agri TaxID=2728837 RepID=A0A848H1B7_9BURK|nr:Rieske 2Fe-2S domain-containing protein [Ramlibacter agri]